MTLLLLDRAAARAGALTALAILVAAWIAAWAWRRWRDRQDIRRGWAGHGGDIDQSSHERPDAVQPEEET